MSQVDSDSLEETWSAFAGGLSPTARDWVRLASRAIGSDDAIPPWDRYVSMAPNRALPRFALSARARERVDDASLSRFVRAHHHAAFYWIIADRLVDRQTPPSRALSSLRGLLLDAWVQTLGDALSDRTAARRLIAEDLRTWRRGLALDRAALSQRQLDPATYMTAVRLRLRCVTTCTRALLLAHGLSDEANAARHATELFLFSCQCRDDAMDVEEDRACRGASVPELLGVVPGALFRVAPRVAASAREVASRGGLDAFAQWLDGYARGIQVALRGDDIGAQVFGALAVWSGVHDEMGVD